MYFKSLVYNQGASQPQFSFTVNGLGITEPVSFLPHEIYVYFSIKTKSTSSVLYHYESTASFAPSIELATLTNLFEIFELLCQLRISELAFQSETELLQSWESKTISSHLLRIFINQMSRDNHAHSLSNWNSINPRIHTPLSTLQSNPI